jgi:hypothetical protein
MTFDMATKCISRSMNVPVNLAPGATPPGYSYCSGLQVAYSPFSNPARAPEDSRASASMVGLALALEDVTYNEPLPINLAYYVKREAQDIPLVGKTAFAQGIGDDLILSTFYSIWELVRNLSYALMAIFMLIIGVMIMLRHQVGARTVVTLQYALPRIIIAVILTTLSYPIVALVVSMLIPFSAMMGALIPDLSPVPLVWNLWRLTWIALLNTTGWGLATAVITIVASFIVLFFLFKLFVVLIMSYIKIMLSAFTGPLVFAWSSIPGNEDALKEWFKRLGINAAAVPAMFFGLKLADYFTDSIIQAITGNVNAGRWGYGGALVQTGVEAGAGLLAFTAPALIVVLMMQLGKLPDKMEEMAFGRKRR